MSVTLAIVMLTVLVSWAAFENRSLFEKLTHHPYVEHRNKEYYRFLTSALVHGSWGHLLINMFVFYQFGEPVEQYFMALFGAGKGRLFFLLLYVATTIFADLPTFVKYKNAPHFRSVGASGAVSGILFAFVIFQPWAMLLLFFVIPMPAILAAVGYLVYSSWAGKNKRDMIDHSAHFYGAVFGFLFTIALKPELFAYFVRELIQGW